MRGWMSLAAALVGLDQLTKVLAEDWLVPYEPLPVLPALNLTLVYNEGAAFSLLSQAGGWQRWLFVGVGLGVTAVLVTWLRGLKPDEHLQGWGLTLIISGALGNLIDRILYGRVVDFIDLYYERWHWPAFNLADTAITVGVGLLIWEALRGSRRPGAAN